jgi:hypothetical protein
LVQIVEVQERVEEIAAVPRQGVFNFDFPVHGSAAAAGR